MKRALQKRAVLILGVILLLFNIIAGAMGQGEAVNVLTQSITKTSLILALYTMIDNRSLGKTILAIGMVSAVIDELYLGFSLTEALSNVGYIGVIGAVVVLICNSFSKTNNSNREMKSVPIWVSIIVWSLYITLILNMAKSDSFEIYGDRKFQLYLAVALTIIHLVFLGVYSGTSLAIQFYLVYTVFQVYTLMELYLTNSLMTLTLCNTLLDIIPAVIIFVKAVRKGKRTWKKKSESKEKETKTEAT